jgi:hypothetical protein
MNANVGNLDRIARIIAGLALIVFALLAKDVSWSWVGWIGLVPLITGLAGRCPAYAIFGVSSCPLDKKAGNAR